MKTANKIDFLIKKLGISDVEFKDAGEGRKFTNSGTRYKLYFSQDGKRLMQPIASGAFDSLSSQMFALQFKAAKAFGGIECPIYEYRSNYGSSIKQCCPICGGYGIKPTFDYQ